MPSTPRVLALARLFVLAAAVLPAVPAQEGPPAPAPELKQLAPLVGNWKGLGVFNEPGSPPSKWTGHLTYRWCLDGHFLQEDFKISFEGDPTPLVFRCYVGWDRENKRFVNAVATNSGEVKLHELKMLPDGVVVQLSVQNQGGTPCAQQWVMKVDGDTMIHSTDLFMLAGPLLRLSEGVFTRTDEAFDGAFDTAPWGGFKPDESVRRLARSAGTFDVAGKGVPMPGMSPIQTSGVDHIRTLWSGLVVHNHTEVSAEAWPGKYVMEAFWGFDAARGCLLGVHLSNWGDVMLVEGRFVDSGEMVGLSSGMVMGQPMAQRLVLKFDENGVVASSSTHLMLGTAPPFESFSATCKKR